MATLVTQAVPERSLEQRRSALALANTIRTHRAALKRQLAAGEVQWDSLLADPLCNSMKSIDVLLALPKVGRVKAYRALSRCGVSPSKTLSGLTDRQLGELKRYLP